MYNKNKSYTLDGLIEIFCKERESLRDLCLRQLTGAMFPEIINYFFDKWIESARQCTTEQEFDQLLRESLRMTFDDWFSSL